MKNKLRQVTDSIHETIYLSDIESELVSTPYFYRLHDIYQSATVYLTFPSNRTKRYEHSLGTMEVSSSMLFSCISNSDIETKEAFFDGLDHIFLEIFDTIYNHFSAVKQVSYLNEHYSYINIMLSRMFSSNRLENYNSYSDYLKENISNYMQYRMANNRFNDVGLNRYQYYLVGLNNDKNTDGYNCFLYQCILQSLRIVALFHDVGHPPFSHMVENVIDELYREYKIKYSKKDDLSLVQQHNIKEFLSCLDHYYTNDNKINDNFIKTRTIYLGDNTELPQNQLNEKISVNLLMTAFEDVIPKMIDNIINYNDYGNDIKIMEILYYIIVVEFAMGILTEKNNLFSSLHRIVDGTLDADRFDYISRDSYNSGVNWGQVPFKRIIDSAKLFLYNQQNVSNHDPSFIIAYPKKLANDLEEVLLLRYKIFAKINYHHRCMKTSLALQSAVKELAENFLNSSDSEECINKKISILWTSLGETPGDQHLKIIRWNDSSLISELYNSLIKLNSMKDLDESYIPLKEDLEEILLNKKRYYAVFKRDIDVKNLTSKIFEYAGISDELIMTIAAKEYSILNEEDDWYNKIRNSDMFTPPANAWDSIVKLQYLKQFKETGDFEILHRMIALDNVDLISIISSVMNEFKHNKDILDYKLHINELRGNNGLPKPVEIDKEKNKSKIIRYESKNIMIYDEKGYYSYEGIYSIPLKNKLDKITKEIIYIYLYIVPYSNSENLEILMDNIQNEIAKSVGKQLESRFFEWFPKSKNTK